MPWLGLKSDGQRLEAPAALARPYHGIGTVVSAQGLEFTARTRKCAVEITFRARLCDLKSRKRLAYLSQGYEPAGRFDGQIRGGKAIKRWKILRAPWPISCANIRPGPHQLFCCWHSVNRWPSSRCWFR